MESNLNYVHASLCTGIGACELAAKWMGWSNAFSCEINKFCRRILKYYYPESQHYENIYETKFTKWGGKIDVLTAGFPCQPFSVAGARKGREDDRYLWEEVFRVVGEIRPRWFVGENVAGLLSMVLPGDEIKVGSYTDVFGENYSQMEMRQQFVVDRICSDLENIGYSVQPIVIPACAVGAPHRRDRIWFVANRSDARVESMHRGQNKIYGFTATTHAAGGGIQGRVTFGGKKNEKKANAEELKRHAANPNKFNDNLSGFFAGQFSQQQASGIFQNIPDWQNFPSQSPVCCGNDGISSQLSGITFSEYRREAIKAYGNSMVPQVVYQIFKCIEEVEKEVNN